MSISAATVQQDDPGRIPPMQAVALYDALTTLTDVIDALLCQPRFGGWPGCNAAGEVLSYLRDQVAEQADAAMADAALSEPTETYARQDWATTCIRHLSHTSEDTELLVAFAKILAVRAQTASTQR